MKNILYLSFSLLVLSTCQTCTDGQLVFQGRCVDVPYIQGCNTYASDASCTLCDYGYSLAQNKCQPTNTTADCCAAYASDGSCSQCSVGLLYSDPSCIRKHIHACLLRQGAQCAVCASGYALVGGVCLPRISNCVTITQEGECVGCQAGWTLVNGYCLPWVPVPFCASQNANGCVRCQDGYFLAQDRSCQPAQPGCLKYWQGKCLACHPSYQSSAQLLIAGCLNYISTGCSKCEEGLSLQNGRCFKGNCARWNNDTCLQCKAEFRLSAEGCVNAVSFGCQACQKGFVFLNGSCVATLVGCVGYSKAGVCASCNSNFNLTVNGVCQITGCELYSDTACTKCGLPFQLTNSVCSIPNCQQFNSQGCTACADNFQLALGQCYPKDPLCATYAANDKGVPVCQQCVAKYYLKDGGCLLAERGCIYDNSGKCSCAPRFALTKQGKCQIAGCTDYNQNACVGCASPFVLADAACVVPNCDQISWNGCDTCKSGYLLVNLQCTLKDENCLSYAGGDCQSCRSGFLLDQNKWCYRNVPNCVEMSSDRLTCIKCNCEFLLVGGQCKTPLPNCRLHNADASLCLGCSDKFHLFNSSCQPNDIRCASYSNATDTQTCLSCVAGYFLSGNGCVKKLPGCIYTNSVCSSCSAPFYYDNSTQSCFIIGCASACDYGCDQCSEPFALSSFYKNCTVANCAQYSRTSCSGCLSGYTLRNGRCEIVDVNCESFSNQVCQKCKEGYSLIGSRCYVSVEFCEKYYSSGNSTGSCAECRSTHYLADSKCLPRENGCIYENKVCKYCSAPFQKTSKGNSCEIPNCLTTNLTSCVTCKQPFVLTCAGDCTIENCMNVQDGVCVQCRSQFHPKLGVGCVADNPNCLSYDNDGVCELCANDLVLTSSGECEQPTKVCLQACATDKTKCLSCSEQYFLNRFYQCEKRDGRCSVYTNGVCSVCQKDYFLYSGICFPYTKGCVKYQGKDCVQCRDLFTLRNGECFKLAPNGMKLLGDGDIYDFAINPIDVRQSKYYINNCDSVCDISTPIASSFQSNFSSPLTGWKALNNDSNQWVGFSLVNGSESFYVVQIEGFDNGYITSFYLEYSIDGTNFIKVQNKFDVAGQGKKTTIYFTGIYCRAIRLRVATWVGWVSAKVEFFYYDALRFKKISSLKSLKYLNETISSNFVDRVDNQIFINQAYFFNPVAACTSSELCFTGLQLCEPRKIIGLALTFNDKDSQVQEFYLTYTIDGRSYNCLNGCAKITVGNLANNSWKTNIEGLKCQGVRIYPTKFKGSPQFAPTFYYE